MAICTYCNREMMDGVSCVDTPYSDMPDKPRIPYRPDHEHRCHDCRCPPGGYHHPGCDMEDCPSCGGQAISCGCGDEDDPELE